MSSRQNLSSSSEESQNQLINVLFTAEYAYQALASWAGRDTVSLYGFQRNFLELRDKKREQALLVIKFLSTRGGIVSFRQIPAPLVAGPSGS